MNVSLAVCVSLAAGGPLFAADWGRAPNGEFWNGNAQRFIYAPAFGFREIAGATNYEFEVTDDYHRTHRFLAPEPTASLASVWDALPIGYVTVVVRGNGLGIGADTCAGRRTFWKKAAFNGGRYDPAKCSHALASRRIYDYFMRLPQTRHLLEKGFPDMGYPLNGYPAKMLSAEIRAMLDFRHSLDANANNDGCRQKALAIARAAADCLIAGSVPEGQALASCPRTYAPEGSEYGRFKGEQDTIMMNYPATAGAAFLSLYDETKDARYLDAAERIARVYLRLQGKDGTWPLKLNAVTGAVLSANRLVPMSVITFLEKAFAMTGRDEFRAAADRAFGFLERGPMRDWDWEGQFEDVKPAERRWSNLTKHPACSVAMYLLKRFPGDAERLAQAEELVKFSEDQFVEWEVPYDNGRHADGAGEDDGTWTYFCRPYSKWATPCVLEQYSCYYPIDASAVKLIETYLALWRATHKEGYLARAKALGDTATRMQEPDGFVSTWWIQGVNRHDDRYHVWLNCMLGTARALDALSRAERQVQK